jgi:hypothetical protein
MWFDDDSCLAPGIQASWWNEVYHQMADTDVLGKIWGMRWQGYQRHHVPMQPWYSGRTTTTTNRIPFATGGWWVARTRVLQQWDYPFKDIIHNGGDVMLGELIRQQNLRLKDFDRGVWINADAAGNASKAPRRGESCKPVWFDQQPPDWSHHDFTIEAYDPKRLKPPVSAAAMLQPVKGFLRLPGWTSRSTGTT